MDGIGNKYNVVNLTYRAHKSDTTPSLHDVRMKMAAASNAKKPDLFVKSLLEDLKEQIIAMFTSGHSFEDIAELLNDCGITLSASKIRDYYFVVHSSRLDSCEKYLTGCFHSGCDQKIERAIFVENLLRQAIEDGRGMLLHYQPQINMHTGKVVGAEALLRFDISGVILSPSEAIPIAEKSGLILPIGDWVLRHACLEAKRWHAMKLDAGHQIKMSINISAKQFNEHLPAKIHGVICDIGLPTKLFGIEITESFLVSNESIDILHKLRTSGIQTSIDDFGTGYSCLSELKDMPLDTIKIDRAFVNNIEQGGNSLAIVEAIIGLAGKLGMNTLAEGVETIGQVNILKNMGCSIAQGFYYSSPLSSEEFIKYVNKNA